jgi:hypothetical protein
VLLNIFCLYRPDLLDEDNIDGDRILQGGEWVRERWWHTSTRVCQRWRYLMLRSASYLGLRLVCSRGTPVADMLAHSPPLPLIIDHINRDPVTTAEDEEGILLALQHHDRVRRVRLRVPVPNLQKLIVAMEEEYPIDPGIPIYLNFDEAKIELGTSQDPSGTTTALPRLDELRLSNNVPNAFDCHEPRHALASEDPPILLISTQMICFNGFRLCLRWRSSGSRFSLLFLILMSKGTYYLRRSRHMSYFLALARLCSKALAFIWKPFFRGSPHLSSRNSE